MSENRRSSTGLDAKTVTYDAVLGLPKSSSSGSGDRLGSHAALLELMKKKDEQRKKAISEVEKYKDDPIISVLSEVQAEHLKGSPWAAAIIQEQLIVAEKIDSVQKLVIEARLENRSLKSETQKLKDENEMLKARLRELTEGTIRTPERRSGYNSNLEREFQARRGGK